MENTKTRCMQNVKRMIVLLLWINLWSLCWGERVASPREVVNLNREWKYMRGDHKGAEWSEFDDTDWETIGIPHSFSIPYFMSKDFYVGYGWYRKSLRLTEKDLNKQLFLEFDGVFLEAEIYVNGKRIKKHVGGYTGFQADISSAVKKGDNQIAVRVNNLWKPDVAPRAGEHVFSGGIYRNVRLVKKALTHIDWCGVGITTPDLGMNRGKASVVQIETNLCNLSANDEPYQLTTWVTTPDGVVVASVESSGTIVAHDTKKVKQTTKTLENPRLWHPNHPYLYKVVSCLFKQGKLLDKEEVTFGFRWFEWTADRGFFLNGEHLYLKGANVHQDQAGWGDAVTETAMWRDVCMMKEAGFNFIRGSHYPHAPAFSQACDEEGMLLWSEAPFWGIGGFKPDGYWDASAYPVREQDVRAFEESALQQLEEMIRIHRNHPSIVAWSMCNEAFFSAPEAMEGVRHLLKRMVDRSHQLDSTRPAAIGGAQRPLGSDRIDLLGDIAGYNGDGSTVPDFQNPGKPNLVSEYGSTTAERPGDYIPGWGDLQKDDGWKGYPWRSGQAIWCGFDHGSIAGSQLGKMGIVDYFRIPKRSWYWYRNEYSRTPPPQWPVEGIPAQLKLDATKTWGVRADGTDDVQLLVSVLDAEGNCLSNSPDVELRLLSGPGEFPTGSAIRFSEDSDIRITDGKAAIAFRSFYAGTAVVEASAPGLKAARVNIEFTDAPRYRKGKTPEVQERPYIRYVRAAQERTLQTFGRNNPTFASTCAQGCAAGHAADGNLATWWQPDKADEHIFWMLDTEKGLELATIQLCFPHAKAYRYKVEISMDQLHWETLSDQQGNTFSIEKQEIKVGGKKNARFVRVCFPQADAVAFPALAEVIVTGTVLE